MRGKGASWKCLIDCKGITPAYAGKSCYRNLIAVDPRDHPRLCGEKSLILCTSYNRKGSPPPMRGKDNGDLKTTYINRITPAYAGKSQARPQQADTSQDHPRLCGEKETRRGGTSILLGSPPPMRGKGGEFASYSVRTGITPAYAGKSTHRRNFFIKT